MSTKHRKNPEITFRLTLFVVGVAVGAIVMFLSSNIIRPSATTMEVVGDLTGPIKYNCELSDGTFNNGTCSCPLEEELGQTQEIMYDRATGFCQTTAGGPGGDAFAASIGLPYGAYIYWNSIVFGQCELSGGYVSGAACICPSEKIYEKTIGQCK